MLSIPQFNNYKNLDSSLWRNRNLAESKFGEIEIWQNQNLAESKFGGIKIWRNRNLAESKFGVRFR
jgi:hypothetical protein